MDIELAMEKGLIVNGDDSNYKEIQKIYYDLFEKYILSVTNIKAYDEELSTSALDFGKSNFKQVMKMNEESLMYIFLINTFYVERLNEEDINLLKHSHEYDQEVIVQMIERTYKQIILHEANYCIGLPNRDKIIEKDAIALLIIYGRNKMVRSDDKFIENMKGKEVFLNHLKEKIKKEVMTSLGLPCQIIIEKVKLKF